jgi:hypothetical protein
MISRSELSRRLPENDMAMCVAYVDGDLSSDERIAFELRLAAEPALAAATEALLDTDHLLRKLEGDSVRQVARVRRMRPWLWSGSLAVAAAALTALGIHLLAPGAGMRVPSFRVAVAPSFESSSDFVASVPDLQGLRPAGLDVLRGSSEEPNIAAPDFAAKASTAEDRLASTALDGAPREVTAGYFVVPLELARPSDVAIYALPKSGPHDAEVAPLFAAPIDAGRHVLPSQRFQLDGVTGASVHYERGFLVPVGAGELEVVIGVRERSAAAAEVPRVRDAQSARHALEQHGFAVRVLHVHEPAD